MRVVDESGDLSKVMHSIKRNFTVNFKKFYNIEESVRIWQRGFCDHIIRDEKDLEKHMAYIHWNPVKHGYVMFPEDWDELTYRFWCKKGLYEDGWGVGDVPKSIKVIEFE